MELAGRLQLELVAEQEAQAEKERIEQDPKATFPNIRAYRIFRKRFINGGVTLLYVRD